MAEQGWVDRMAREAVEDAVRSLTDPLYFPRPLERLIARWTAAEINRQGFLGFERTSEDGVWNSHQDDMMTRLVDIAERSFPHPRTVFHKKRWSVGGGELPSAFQRRCEEENKNPQAMWRELAQDALAEIIRMPEGLPDEEQLSWLRGQMWGIIERDLLHGSTTDRKTELLLDDLPEKERIAAERRLTEVESDAARREEAMRLYQEFRSTLTPKNQAILLAEHGGLRKIAEAQGKSYEAVKKQHGRLWHEFVAWSKERVVL